MTIEHAISLWKMAALLGVPGVLLLAVEVAMDWFSAGLVGLMLLGVAAFWAWAGVAVWAFS